MKPEEINILVAYEESQAVTIELRKMGFNAFSLDRQPCSGGHPEWHLQKDSFPELYLSNLNITNPTGKDRYHLVISFPPCTDLAVSGARYFDKKRLSGQQAESIDLFLTTWYYSHVTENPIGIMNGGPYIKKWFPNLYQKAVQMNFPFKPSQIIQPWQFGHGETKATCLWLKGLPLLKPTNIVEGREQRIWKMPPSKDRAKLRSKTYEGIAAAMADQWGKYLLETLTNQQPLAAQNEK